MNKWTPVDINYLINVYSFKTNNLINVIEIYDNSLISLIEKTEENKYYIFLNKSIEEIYNRFILAHSFSHIFLNHFKSQNIIQEIEYHFDKNNNLINEQEANKAAINLLIPNELYNFLSKKHSKKEIGNMLKVPSEIINNYF